MRERRNN